MAAGETVELSSPIKKIAELDSTIVRTFTGLVDGVRQISRIVLSISKRSKVYGAVE